MVDVKNPAITIGGVPIQEQNFTWELTSGVHPYTTHITLPNSLSNKLLAIQNPTNIVVNVWGGFGDFQPLSYEIKNVYLLEPRQVDPYHATWTIADARYIFHGAIMQASYNMTRIQNSFGTSNISPMGSPAELRADFDLFNQGRYIPNTVKNDGKPYTALEIAQSEAKYKGVIIGAIGTDQSYYLENIQFFGEDWYACMANILSQARLDMGINLAGGLYIYSVDFDPEKGFEKLIGYQNSRSCSSSTLFVQDRKRIRPKQINIWYEAKQEIWVSAVETEYDFKNQSLLTTGKDPLWSKEDASYGNAIGAR